MASHPDKKFAKHIYDGLSHGFHVGFCSESIGPPRQVRNYPSALEHEHEVQRRITAELEAGRLLGPLSQHLTPFIHVSPLSLVPKQHQANKWRLVVDLSSPTEASVNDGIAQGLCSLKYASVDEAVSLIRQLGRGTKLVKIDIKDAYRIVPIHPDDYHLLGITWKGATYIDRALPFGLRSAPKIFSAIADFMAWILHQQGIRFQLHYLDDFLFLGEPNSQEAALCLETTVRTFQHLSIPIAAHKTEGPSTTLVFLGILIDTELFELRLPEEKLTRLQEAIKRWAGWKYCRRADLQSLLGLLSHAATVVPNGRTFLRKLFPLLALDRAQNQIIRLSAGAKADLRWWMVFLQGWNGKSFFQTVRPTLEIFSDASGSYGCGAFAAGHNWFQLQWPEDWAPVHITAKELLPVVIAAAVWGTNWRRGCICFRSDNQAVVDIINSRTSKDDLNMHLVRCLVLYAVIYGFNFMAEHIPGVQNTAADAISRNNLTLFHSLIPQVRCSIIPQPVIYLLVTKKPDWGSKEWTQAFKASLTREFQRPHRQPIAQDGDNTQSTASHTTSQLSPLRKTPSASSLRNCPSQ